MSFIRFLRDIQNDSKFLSCLNWSTDQLVELFAMLEATAEFRPADGKH